MRTLGSSSSSISSTWSSSGSVSFVYRLTDDPAYYGWGWGDDGDVAGAVTRHVDGHADPRIRAAAHFLSGPFAQFRSGNNNSNSKKKHHHHQSHSHRSSSGSGGSRSGRSGGGGHQQQHHHQQQFRPPMAGGGGGGGPGFREPMMPPHDPRMMMMGGAGPGGPPGGPGGHYPPPPPPPPQAGPRRRPASRAVSSTWAPSRVDSRSDLWIKPGGPHRRASSMDEEAVVAIPSLFENLTNKWARILLISLLLITTNYCCLLLCCHDRHHSEWLLEVFGSSRVNEVFAVL